MDDELAVRTATRQLAQAAIDRGEPLAWFEELYSRNDMAAIPWADLRPNPNLVDWIADTGRRGDGRRALVVGAGLGDDAEAIAELGYATTAFDIAPSGIGMARARFPESTVQYAVADLLALPADWHGAFDFVFEAYTLQSLPSELRADAARGIAGALALGGEALVVSRGRDEDDPRGNLPWPLTVAELKRLFRTLELVTFEDYLDTADDPPARRLRALFRR